MQPILNIQNSLNCYDCNKPLPNETIKKCSRCSIAIYCGRECQVKNWPKHKMTCTPPKLEKNETIDLNTNNKNLINSPTKFIYQSKENESIRTIFFNTSKKEICEHVKNVRKTILENLTSLNSKKSVITVFGAQFFNKEFVEPLPSLLEKCSKMILVDVDRVTLQSLKKMLNNPKVVTIEIDLTGAHKKIQNLFIEAKNQKWTSEDAVIKCIDLFEEVIKEEESIKNEVLKSLEITINSDYVISSLVGSILCTSIKEDFSYHCKPLNIDLFGYIEKNQEKKSIQLLAKTFFQLNHLLLRNHFEILTKCAGLSGALYYADTNRVTINNHTSLIIPIEFLLETIGNYRKNWKNKKAYQWDWFNGTSQFGIWAVQFPSN